MLVCKKIRLEVTEQDAASLEFMQGKCRGLYNWHVMRLRDGTKWNLYDAKKSLQESKQYDPKLAQVYGKLLHEVFYRLDAAMQAHVLLYRVRVGHGQRRELCREHSQTVSCSAGATHSPGVRCIAGKMC